MMKMTKRGQAAMEFLMTYGWAILVVLAAIGALAYFGVLSPDQLLPERTTFAAPISNLDNAVVTSGAANTATVIIPFKNNVGYKINLTDVNVTAATGTCGNVVGVTVRVADDTTENDIRALGGIDIKNGDNFVVTMTCAEPIDAGKFKDEFKLVYTNTFTGVARPHTGTVTAKAN